MSLGLNYRRVSIKLPPRKVIDPNLHFIQDSVYMGFRERQYKAMGQNVRDGIWHVSDLVQDCMRNTFYNKLKAIPQGGMDTTTMSIFFAGESVHRMLDSVYSDETKLMWDVVNDKAVTKTSDVRNVLYGECDAVYDVDVDGTSMKCIVDYKTWLSKGFKLKAPKEDHVRQINMYKYLLNKCKSVDISYGSVIYLDFEDRMAKPLVFTFALDPVHEIEEHIRGKMAELRESVNTGVLPARVKTWKCDGYCPHASRCFTEDSISKSELEMGIG